MQVSSLVIFISLEQVPFLSRACLGVLFLPAILNHRPSCPFIFLLEIFFSFLFFYDSFLMNGYCFISVTAYKCNVMGPDCSICISVSRLREKYRCGWCGTSCKYSPTCNSLSTNCPQPQLISVSD